MGVKKRVAMGLTALTLWSAEKGNAQWFSPYADNSRATQQALRNTLLLPNPNNENNKNDTAVYTTTPEEIEKARTHHSMKIISYITKFDRDFRKVYTPYEIAKRLNTLLDTYPNFDALSQEEKQRVITEVFPEFVKQKKSDDRMFWLLLSTVISGMLGVIVWSVIPNIQSRREKENEKSTGEAVSV